MFIRRNMELHMLEKHLSGFQMSTAFVYGRRRVGLSALVLKAVHNSHLPCVYFVSTETTDAMNAELLTRSVEEILQIKVQSDRGVKGALSELLEKANTCSVALVIDRYDVLRRICPGIDDLLIELISKYKSRSGIKLILCGADNKDLSSAIQDHSLLLKSMDLVLRVNPMDYADASQFYPGLSSEDKIALYACFGGVPYYLQNLEQSSARQNIIRLITEPGARLEDEVTMILLNDANKLNNLHETLASLAQGNSRFSDILASSHVTSSPTLVDVLDRLVGMQLVSREFAVNETCNKKKMRYVISDPLTFFYYRYCFVHSGQRVSTEPDQFYDRYVKTDFEKWYLPRVFPYIVRQFFLKQRAMGYLDFDDIGFYVYHDAALKKQAELDLVIRKGMEYIPVFFRADSEPVGKSYVDSCFEIAKNAGIQTNRMIFVAQSFSVRPREDLMLIRTESLYEY